LYRLLYLALRWFRLHLRQVANIDPWGVRWGLMTALGGLIVYSIVNIFWMMLKHG
jgi:FtsH-binding integral membrane protein